MIYSLDALAALPCFGNGLFTLRPYSYAQLSALIQAAAKSLSGLSIADAIFECGTSHLFDESILIDLSSDIPQISKVSLISQASRYLYDMEYDMEIEKMSAGGDAA